jgi:hypothetical protein
MPESMDMTDTPILGQSQPDEQPSPSSQVSKKCLDHVEKYRKGARKPVDKAATIQNIVSLLAGTTPELTEDELNDSLGTYLKILEQQDQAIVDAMTSGEPLRPETVDVTPIGSKRAASPGQQTTTGKKQKQDDSNFPWVVRERLSDSKLCESLESTLALLRVFAKDPKFAKSSVVNSAHAPPFPHSEWTNILAGSMADLDHVISGSFAVANDNRDVELIGSMELKFGVAKPIKRVKTSGDWFIAWGAYTKAVVFVFPHRKEELELYGTRILSLFAATTAFNHLSIVNLDKGIRARVGESRNLLLMDHAAFDDLRLYWLNPLGGGVQPLQEGMKKGREPGYQDDEPCYKWNAGECNKKASECRHRHFCELCHGSHRKSEHKAEHPTAT